MARHPGDREQFKIDGDQVYPEMAIFPLAEFFNQPVEFGPFSHFHSGE